VSSDAELQVGLGVADTASSGGPMVRAEKVWKSFGKLDVLKGIDFVVYHVRRASHLDHIPDFEEHGR
jgi:hypothetical protein